MGLINIQYQPGQTPLDDDEKDGLLIHSITTKKELDEVEQHNIEAALRWPMDRRKRFPIEEVLTERFVTDMHIKMLGQVWRWAGHYRLINKNIGIDKYYIGTELRMLLDACTSWLTNPPFPADEIAIRFTHRIVSIHCFANGNGRHSRLIADVIIEKLLSQPIFTWGTTDLIKKGEERGSYLKALREADIGNYELLIKFARS